MKLAYHALNLAKLLYDRTTNPVTKIGIAQHFFESEAKMVLEEMERKIKEGMKQ